MRHSHKAMLVIADRILTGDLNIPRESAIPLLADIVCKDKIKLDPSRNDFPVTLHDPCNMVRLMGIVGAPEADPQKDLPAVQGNGAARRGQLLLWGRQWVCHHAIR